MFPHFILELNAVWWIMNGRSCWLTGGLCGHFLFYNIAIVSTSIKCVQGDALRHGQAERGISRAHVKCINKIAICVILWRDFQQFNS